MYCLFICVDFFTLGLLLIVLLACFDLDVLLLFVICCLVYFVGWCGGLVTWFGDFVV